MIENMFSLVSDPLLTVRKESGTITQVSLPAVLSLLAKDDIVSFEALQTHQKQAWHCFLVQLAAIALSHAGRNEIPTETSDWNHLLLALTSEEENPWCLVVEDVSKPAFMQSPVPEGSLDEANYKTSADTPDSLDVLVTAKNHDVKMHRISHPKPEHWIYSLVTLQTMEGYLGKGNYGIVRMNGGFASRPLVGITPALEWPIRFNEDLNVLLGARPHLIEDYGYQASGLALLWLQPWDGTKDACIPLADCDPLFIEICRRVRFIWDKEEIHCLSGNTNAARIALPDDFKGVTGDPWTPVRKKDEKALTVGRNGFSYELIKEVLLTGEYASPVCMSLSHNKNQASFLVATVLVRGQGKTEGFHHRVVPVPPKAMSLLASPTQREKLGTRSEDRVTKANDVANRVLRPTLYVLISGKTGSLSAKQRSNLAAAAQRWLRAFDRSVDDVFFEDLWESLNCEQQVADKTWQGRLRDFASREFVNAKRSCAHPSIAKYRVLSAAESIFNAGIRRELPALFDENDKED